ncbi:Reticulocyte-binding protein 2 like protein a [Eufriesea mexicana]|nr:Reticulocyte-binding protein 2 like protein a [Eufriesea mexicana]
MKSSSRFAVPRRTPGTGVNRIKIGIAEGADGAAGESSGGSPTELRKSEAMELLIEAWIDLSGEYSVANWSYARDRGAHGENERGRRGRRTRGSRNSIGGINGTGDDVVRRATVATVGPRATGSRESDEDVDVGDTWPGLVNVPNDEKQRTELDRGRASCSAFELGERGEEEEEVKEEEGCSGRAGSPSPSPPTSPPPSPAKEAKTTANVDLANVRDACHEARDSGTSGKRSPQQSTSSGTCTTEFRDFTGRRSPTASGDSREKRSTVSGDFGKRLGCPEARDGKRGSFPADARDGRSVSPEKGRQQYEDNRGSSGGYEYGRPDSRLGRQSPGSPGSSPEPEDNSSTSGDEAGAASEETNQRSSSAHNRHSLTKACSSGGRFSRFASKGNSIAGEESDGTPGTPSSVYLRVNRRRTDLMPTIPSPRDGPPSSGRSSSAKAFTRSPGKSLKRSDNSRSMGTLPGAVPMPRPTRAERLRRKAREHQNQQQQGIRSGEVTPNSPSRPHSSMSQQSASSVGSSNVNLRPRTAAPRRPRPASIAGTGVSVTERHNLLSETKSTKDSKPPLPKVHSTPKKSSTPKATEIKKPTEKLVKNAKASPRITPKATPLQSPGVENVPLIRGSTGEIIKSDGKEDPKLEDKHEEKKDQGTEKTQQEINAAEQGSEDAKKPAIIEQPSIVTKQAKDESNLNQENQSAVRSQEAPKSPKKEAEAKPENIAEEPVDMSASMIAKIRITTEEEAKAAIAERRRLAREQAEREAELERQRQEEEARLEAERLRIEEEEQRRLEEETLRLADAAREAEEQRLRLAIEEAKRREEEDRRKREEEARQKLEKEEAERKAREEAERQWIEMAERLKKEEEERLARRKRVEAIMLRTRGKNQNNTPTKGESGEGDKLKEDSPNDENKTAPGSKSEDVMTASLISEATQQFISGEQRAHHTENNTTTDIVHNGTHSNGINESKIVLDNNQGNVEGELNGHHTNHGNGINSQSITLDNATVKQNNVTNNLLDLTEFDSLSNSSSGPILELTSNLANEDTLNSNLNPAAIPFTPMANTYMPTAANANVNPFQDSFINNKPQDNSQVPGTCAYCYRNTEI